MNKHTPGPWLIRPIHAGFKVLADGPGDQWPVAMCTHPADVYAWADEVHANSLLIAAAPELLAELESAVEGLLQAATYCRKCGDPAMAEILTEQAEQHSAAIRKARGE